MSASKKVEAFVMALEIKLLMIGVDPTLIVLRGPTVAILGVALSILAYLFHRVQSQTVIFFGSIFAPMQLLAPDWWSCREWLAIWLAGFDSSAYAFLTRTPSRKGQI